MEKKFGKIIANAGKNTKDILEKAKDTVAQVVDQNEDGNVDLKDISIMASAAGDIMKKGVRTLKETTDEKARQMELKTLQPIFLSDLNDFFMPEFVRITERDKKYAKSEVCEGSIGFLSVSKGVRLVNIFRDSVDAYGLSFYPNCIDGFYYIDPSDRNAYIALDEYFDYLKQVRIGELQRIAQYLGAKHFRVTYMEEKKSFSEKKENKKATVKPIASADITQDYEEKNYSRIEIAAEMECPGHTPIKPQLKYMKYDPSIVGLVEMRLNEQGPLMHQKLMLKLSNSSRLKESEAAKIDAVLKGMKCSGNATVVSEVQNESRKYLEYEIDF